MKKIAILVFVLAATTVSAGDVYNPGASSVGDYPDIDNPSSTAQPTGKILLVDAASFILQVDAASKICRAGGC